MLTDEQMRKSVLDLPELLKKIQDEKMPLDFYIRAFPGRLEDQIIYYRQRQMEAER